LQSLRQEETQIPLKAAQDAMFSPPKEKALWASKISASGSIMPLEDSNAFWIWWSKTLRIETAWNIPI